MDVASVSVHRVESAKVTVRKHFSGNDEFYTLDLVIVNRSLGDVGSLTIQLYSSKPLVIEDLTGGVHQEIAEEGPKT